MLNAEFRILNVEGGEGQEMGPREFDLEDRLVAYAADAIALTEMLPDSRAGNHIASQLLRSGTSAAPNYGEAEAAESRKDFLHKMGICLKELRESRIWLRIIARRKLLGEADLAPILCETEELIRIFKASIATARRNDSSDSP
jgi:four helix bundle protein